MKTRCFFMISCLALLFASCQDWDTFQKADNISRTSLNQMNDAPTEQQLDQLFVILKMASREDVIRETQQKIREIWAYHPDRDIDTLMQMGVNAMYQKKYGSAIRYFSQIIREAPDYAEGWNKRATVHFMQGNFQASLQDIKSTLRLEKRHFGALSGMASIYLLRDDKMKALQVYEKLQKLIPLQSEVKVSIQELRSSLGYRKM